ncbi:hypothetical protein [Gordonia alkanivorans]|uniref:hypothetical protein n=1 Tax=Gordonia alkanivorans TaxID=84096 RepID=UPI0024B76ADA|nr:hypothetical protein [Gordonia alkanivorans]MDJ0010141.1 hypothetical protein [Gordonia alkanivorans]MDJ0495669.1 hypothetical protein [Gordonia alkanivorans]
MSVDVVYRVLRIEPGMWEVSTPHGRWWTVARLESQSMQGWYVTNETGRTVKADGQLGRRLIAAVEAKL